MIRQQLLAPLTPFLGIAAMLVVIANASLHGVTGQQSAWPALIVGLLVTAYAARRTDWREMGVVALIFLPVALHFLAPALANHAQLILVDAGDFNQYLGLGSWLTSHPISEHWHADAAYNVLQYNVYDHQNFSLRLGAVHLLALVASLTGQEVTEIYSFVCAGAVGLQAVAVYAFLRAGFPELKTRWAVLAAILYGVSPSATWPAYAAFVPQTLGLGFITALIAFSIDTLRRETWLLPSWRSAPQRWDTFLPLGLLLAACWCIYPEGFPLAAVMLGLTCLLMFRSRLRQAAFWRALLRGTAVLILLWAVLSPEIFLWGMRGLIIQFHTMAHGGPQVSTPLNLFATMTLSTQMPLVQELLAAVPTWANMAAWVLGLSMALGLLAALRQSRIVARAVVLSVLLLLAMVMHKYRAGSIYGTYIMWQRLYDWNLFKAAQYVVPLMAATALAGWLLVAQSRPRLQAALMAAFLAALSLSVSYGQDRQIAGRAYTHRIDPAFVAYLRDLPKDGRLFLNIPQWDYTDRYQVYALLRERAFISRNDWQSDSMFGGGTAEERQSFLGAPIGYILTDTRSDMLNDLPVVSSYGTLRLVDARGRTLRLPVEGNNRQPIHIATGPAGVTVLP